MEHRESEALERLRCAALAHRSACETLVKAKIEYLTSAGFSLEHAQELVDSLGLV